MKASLSNLAVLADCGLLFSVELSTRQIYSVCGKKAKASDLVFRKKQSVTSGGKFEIKLVNS